MANSPFRLSIFHRRLTMVSINCKLAMIYAITIIYLRLARMDHMATLEPLFVTITCGSNGHLLDTTLYIAETAQKVSFSVQFHFS